MHLWLFGALAAAELLSFDDALARTAEAPSVETASAVAETRAAGVSRVPRLTENPVFQLQPGARAQRHGEIAPEVYVGVSQPVVASGLGKLRRASLRGEHDVDVAKITDTERTLRAGVAEAWLTCWAAEAARRYTAEERALAAEFQARMQRAASLGEATAIDVAAARAWAAEAHVAELSAEGDAYAAGNLLARLLGVEGGPLEVTVEAPEILLPEIAALHARVGTVDRMPTVQVAEAKEREADARVRELAATRSTRYAVGVLGWREGSGDVAAVATLEASPAWFERGQRDTASARAEQTRARGLVREARIVARSEREALVHEVVHSAAVLDATENELVIAAEQLASAQTARLVAHEGTAQELRVARRAAWRARIDAARAKAAHLFARFRAAEAFRSSP